MTHPSVISDISLQPGTNGQVFASASSNGILRLIDQRQSTAGMLI